MFLLDIIGSLFNKKFDAFESEFGNILLEKIEFENSHKAGYKKLNL